MLVSQTVAAQQSDAENRHAAKATSPHLTIELNKLEQRDSACRLTLLIENRLGQTLRALDLELVLFARDQRIMRLIAAKAGWFPKAKSRVRQFDLPAIKCQQISRVLVNTINKCEGDELTPERCLGLTRTRSRADVPLIY